MKQRNISILGVCETRYKGKTDKKIHEDYRLLSSGSDDGRHGVGFVVAPELSKHIEVVEQIDERIISISIKLKEGGMSLVQVYAPQQGRIAAEKEEFYRKLQQTVDGIKYGQQLIIIGDWNGHIGSERTGYEDIIGPHSVGTKNVEGDRILNFAVVNRLSIMNTFFQHRDSHKWTWYRWNEVRQEYVDKSMIDLVATSKKQLICDVKAVPSVSLDADHRLVVTKVRLKAPSRKSRKGYSKYDIEKLDSSVVVEQFQTRIRANIENSEQSDEVENKWNAFKDNLKTAAEQTIGVKKVYCGRKKTTAWWTLDVKNSVKMKMKAFRLWMKTRTPEHRLSYVLQRNETERIKRIEKTKAWNDIGKDLKEDHKGTKKLLFSLAKNYRGKNTEVSYAIKDKGQNLLVEPEAISERWKEYFEELLNSDGTTDDEFAEDIDQPREENQEQGPITVRELESAMKAMKNGKATGEDGIPVEIIKSAGLVAKMQLVDLFNAVFRMEQVPEDWQRGVICPIFKKGERTECRNHRGVMLLSHIGKLYNRIIEKRLRWCVEDSLGEGQYGFRPGRSTSDLIFAMKMILEKGWEWNREKYIMFIDLEKAFDRVPRNLLWTALSDEHYNIPQKLIRVIRNMYSKCPTKVKCQAQDSNWFNVNTGVRQGDVLSPLLFIIFMDKCMRNIGAGELGEETLVYADDVAIVADNIVQLQTVADRWKEGMDQNTMKINTGPGKTEFMVVSRREQEYELSAGELQIKKVDKYKYLGIQLDQNYQQDMELNTRINKYNGTLALLYPLLKEKAIPRQCKTTMYTMILRPILTYSCETWTLTTTAETKIQAAEMKVLRLIRGVTKRDKMRNTRIREDLKVPPLLEFIEKRRLQWFGHVKRMPQARYPNKYLAWRPEGKRPVGRPRKRWLDCVDKSLRKRGTSLLQVEEERKFEDREGWRRFIHCRPTDR